MIGDRSLAAHNGTEQQPGFGCSARAELDDGEIALKPMWSARRCRGHDGIRVGLEDAALGARQVVLVEGSDFFKEARAFLVIKKPRAEGARPCSESAINL